MCLYFWPHRYFLLAFSLSICYELSPSLEVISNEQRAIWVIRYFGIPTCSILGPVHTYPDIFENLTFSIRFYLSSTRIRRIRSVKTQLFVNAFQSGHF